MLSELIICNLDPIKARLFQSCF